ncbi:MAG: hypothetical protein ACYTFI_28300, partial [Planctomycetota bacterium]
MAVTCFPRTPGGEGVADDDGRQVDQGKEKREEAPLPLGVFGGEFVTIPSDGRARTGRLFGWHWLTDLQSSNGLS